MDGVLKRVPECSKTLKRVLIVETRSGNVNTDVIGNNISKSDNFANIIVTNNSNKI